MILFLLFLFTGSAFAEYVASDPLAIKGMLDAAQVTSKDTLYDLGSGDGRIVIAAAKRGAQAVGIELDPQWVMKSRAAIETERLKNARVIWGDFFVTPLGEASVITVFLPQTLANKLETILRTLRPGVRVVSNGVPIGKWQPREEIDIHQTLCNPSKCWTAPLYLWIT